VPIYEYRCQSCGHEQEFLQKISDPVLTDCPECGQPSLKRLISAAGFRLKGSGWYETDFKSSKQKNLAEKPTENNKSNSDGGAKSETKNAAKSDTVKAKKTDKSSKKD